MQAKLGWEFERERRVRYLATRTFKVCRLSFVVVTDSLYISPRS